MAENNLNAVKSENGGDASSNKYKVLIVDDDSMLADMLGVVLSLEGHKCEVAHNGVEALDTIYKKSFDAVITDIMMPEMDGITLTKKITQLYPDLPIMVMTALIDEYSANDAVDAGASDFINKPFSNRELSLRFNMMMYNYEILCHALRDPLTNTFNRRKFSRELKKEIGRVLRYERPLSLIMLDIDFFKQINDKYGHQAGDYVLQEITRLVNKYVRKTDVLARYGGEEFVVLMPETDINGAKYLAEKLRHIIEIHNFENIEQITCSFGVAEYSSSEDEYDFIRRVDMALYAAKNGGRNKVEINPKNNHNSLK